MKVDIYKRIESPNLTSYLAVPQGKPLPAEATNTDWQADERNIDLEEDTGPLFDLELADALAQIGEKGYAITHLKGRQP
ncbi:DUF6139 family protein [Herminiimonas sp. CN]|uniref:DUF6139 family protein n=1 Tax=Herminiimonas sp. CN TaxID=1349818 RepID=UPI0004733B39|nr:DUF6139 family protein [Herminiimonas sp. CN]